MNRMFVLIVLFLCAFGTAGAIDTATAPMTTPLVSLVIRSRAEWGAKPFVAEKMKPHRITRGIAVHHSAGRAPKPGEENQIAQNIQHFHMNEKKWGDVAYHYFICPSGLILEGRPLDFAGDTGTVYDTAGLEQICMLGTYMKELPTPEALKALAELVRRDMTTLGFKRDKVFAHRELAQTDCPGDELYKWYVDVLKESLP